MLNSVAITSLCSKSDLHESALILPLMLSSKCSNVSALSVAVYNNALVREIKKLVEVCGCLGECYSLLLIHYHYYANECSFHSLHVSIEVAINKLGNRYLLY